MAIHYCHTLESLQRQLAEPQYTKRSFFKEKKFRNHSYVKLGRFIQSHDFMWRMGQIVKAAVAVFFACALLPLCCENYRKSIKKSWMQGKSGLEKISLYAAKSLSTELVRRGNLAFEGGDPDLGLDHINLALELNPQDIEAWQLRGKIYRDEGNFNEALDSLLQADKLDANSVTTLEIRAELFYRKGGMWINSALHELDLVLRLLPDSVYALRRRGDIYCRKGQFDLALQDYERFLELKGDDASALRARGMIYGRLGELDRALADLDRSLKLEPEDAASFCVRGDIFYRRGEFENAIQDFSRILESKPHNAFLLFRRGDCYRRLGRFDEAEQDLNQALKLQSNMASGEDLLGLARAHSCDELKE